MVRTDIYRMRVKVWHYQGLAAWHFAAGFAHEENPPWTPPKNRRGFALVPEGERDRPWERAG